MSPVPTMLTPLTVFTSVGVRNPFSSAYCWTTLLIAANVVFVMTVPPLFPPLAFAALSKAFGADDTLYDGPM